MTRADALIAAAAKLEFIDVAGRIIANPVRHAPTASAAEVFVLACATEVLHAVAIEAELLVRALELPTTGDDASAGARDHAVSTQIDTLKRQFALLRAPTETEKENTNGNDAG